MAEVSVQAVSAHLVETADRELAARFGRLPADSVLRKVGGDLVTSADLACEAALSADLPSFLPGSVVVGEEAMEAGRLAPEALGGPAPVWIVDPLDGTRNFAAGDPDFTLNVALGVGGRMAAAWIVAPCAPAGAPRLAVAEAGSATVLDGAGIRLPPAGTDASDLARAAIVATHPAWRSADDRRLFGRLADAVGALTESRCAGREYLAMLAGERDGAVFTWDKPWDHAAGALLLQQAGGSLTGIDGRPFDPFRPVALPLIAATGRRLAEALRRRVRSLCREVAWTPPAPWNARDADRSERARGGPAVSRDAETPGGLP